MELSGFDPAHNPGQTAPSDWVAEPDCATRGNCAVRWAFDPTLGGIPQGTYVRVVGALVTDEPHCAGASGDLQDAIKKWMVGSCGDKLGGIIASASMASNEAPRWVEVHSPDLIQPVIPAPAHAKTVKGVAVAASGGLLSSGDTNTLDVDLLPPTWMTGPRELMVEEYVGSETNFGTITSGTSQGGAIITHDSDSVHIHVGVTGQGGYVAGKFKAIYKVYWNPNDCSGRPYCCGDGICSSSETLNSCPDDCVATCKAPLVYCDCNSPAICTTAANCKVQCLK
jgi:hypothetical protein